MKKMHSRRTRLGGKEREWHHLDRVSRILEAVLDGSDEGNQEERENIVIAALGHDTLEDTDVTEAEIEEYFGADGLRLIQGMTNRFGDEHPEPYVRQVASAEEGVRLIKLSDLYDNCTSVTYGMAVMDAAWVEGYFLPIVRPMIAALSTVPFETYPRAGGMLQTMVALSYRVLLNELDRYRDGKAD